MSTKTSIKRIALVAAAALAIGGFSAVSASAQTVAQSYLYCSKADGGAITNTATTGATCAGVAGPTNTVTVTGAQSTKDVTYVVSGAGATFNTTTNFTLNTAGTQAQHIASGATDAITINTPTVGTITVKVYAATAGSGIYTDTLETVVITVNATASSGTFSAANSTAYIVTGETSTAAADATIVAAATAKYDTAAATIVVSLKDALSAGYKDTLTATITSGPGVIIGTNDSRTVGTANAQAAAAPFDATASSPLYSKSVSTYDNAAGNELRNAYFGIFANGQAGTTVVSIKNTAGTVLYTKSLVFYSTTPASVKVKVLKANVLNSATATKNVFAVNVYDSGNNEITGTQTITAAPITGSAVNGTVSCATTQDATLLAYLCTAASSSAQVTLATDASETYTFTAGTATANASVKYVSGVIASVKVAGPASADPGTKVSYTLTATGANGSALPDGAYIAGSIFTNADPVTNAQLVAIPFGKGETITLANGVATDYTYAPFSGSLSASWTMSGSASATAATAATAVVDGTSGDTAFTAAGIAKGVGASVVAADDVTITANTEATAAANAATDAANQAADAADNATQAAAEALAAVNTLATTVATLIAGIKSQIASLNKLIVAIKNKLKA